MKRRRLLPFLVLLCSTAALVLFVLGFISEKGFFFRKADDDPPVETAAPDTELGKLRISELMSKNRATVKGEGNRFPDWVELENISDTAVELSGWSLGDRESNGKWPLPALTVQPGELCLLLGAADGTPFSFSEGESAFLFTPAGNLTDSLPVLSGEADVSVIRGEGGEPAVCRLPTPGRENTAESYAQLMRENRAPGPLVISEVMSANNSVSPIGGKYYDMVEIKNVSDAPVQLSDYWLSDDLSELKAARLADISLSAGERFVVFCTDKYVSALDYSPVALFALNGVRCELYLSDGENVIDCLSVHDVPLEGSLCRGEDGTGIYYSVTPSFNAANAPGWTLISDAPEALTPDGIYDGVDSVSVELSAEGEIRYTLDGSLPTPDSELYTEAIELGKTTVVRAIALTEGRAPSRPVTFSYIINEYHTLPVLSLATDSPVDFKLMYSKSTKGVKLPASLSLFEADGRFTSRCGVCLRGWTSLSDEKKSLGVSFGGRWGDGELQYDVFDNGIDEYEDLAIRVGQDQRFAIVRNELCQELCMQMTGRVLAQNGKYCILYINGVYRGLYCLKEEVNSRFYADRAGVSKASVENEKGPFDVYVGSFYNDVVAYCAQNDMSLPENYEHLCSVMDINSFTDWFILEAYTANTDVQGNVRVFRSNEADGKWVFAFYDLDWAFTYPDYAFYGLWTYRGNAGSAAPTIFRSLMENSEYRDKFFTRLAEVNRTVLSNENILRVTEELAAGIYSEVERNHNNWGMSMNDWLERLGLLQSIITGSRWDEHVLEIVSSVCSMSYEEYDRYFG